MYEIHGATEKKITEKHKRNFAFFIKKFLRELLFSFDDENCPILCYSRENARTAFFWWAEKTVILVAARIAFSPIVTQKSNSRRDENCFSCIKREKCNSRRDENRFSLKQRDCFFTSALKQGLVLCAIMTKPKRSKNDIAFSAILQLINKYFFP